MTDRNDALNQYSDGLAARARAAAPRVVAVRTSEHRHISGLSWQADFVVTSEQSLPRRDEFEVVLPGGAVVKSVVAGRDPSTNIVLLRLAQPAQASAYEKATIETGALALAFGADGLGALRARLGIVQEMAAAWSSSLGGHIDKRITLDIRLSRQEEGGPVFDARGGLIGMSSFGVRGQIIVIPHETLQRIVPLLARDGRIARGWLGVKLQPVAVPDSLQTAAGQSSALMAMSIAENGPAAKAGLLAGDIVLSLGATSTGRIRHLAALLGPDSIGKSLDARVIRGGTVLSVPIAIAERPPA